eukprot:3807317-Rhodomonas_salina.2
MLWFSTLQAAATDHLVPTQREWPTDFASNANGVVLAECRPPTILAKTFEIPMNADSRSSASFAVPLHLVVRTDRPAFALLASASNIVVLAN